MTYITKDYIVKAKENANKINNLDPKYFEIIKPYKEGEFYPGLTSNYRSNSHLYDSKTHYYLGQYLRQIRDLHNIDLMSYYNCYSGYLSDKIRIKKTSNNVYKIIDDNTEKDNLRTILVPIKFNREYTLYLNSNTPILYTYVYHNGRTLLRNKSQDLTKGVFQVDNLSFSQPHLIKGIKIEDTDSDIDIASFQNLYSHIYEDYLNLLIQIPASNTSSVVVLEGNYLDNRICTWLEVKTNDKEEIIKETNKIQVKDFIYNNYNIEKVDQNKIYSSPSSLTRIVSTDTVAFNDRLLEYLFLNTITPNDKISKNIFRVQKNISSIECYNQNGFKYKNSYVKGT